VKKTRLLLIPLLIFSWVRPLSGGENRALPEPDQADTPDLLVPRYEPANGDHRYSQVLKGVIRLGAGAFLLTGLGGVYYYRDVFMDPNNSFLTAEPAAVAATTVGFFGSLVGGFYGYYTGEEYNDKRQADSSFHAPRDNIGARILVIFANYPRFHIIYQLLNQSQLKPDEVRGGFVYRFRSGIPSGEFLWQQDKTNYDDSFLALVGKAEAGLIFKYHLKSQNVTPYYGINLGYAWARDCAEYWPDDYQVQETVSSPYVQLLLGLWLNILDYIHLEAELGYEPFGVYYALRKLHDYHYSGNFEFNIFIGSYMFKVDK
jgi:hypothetical protein